MKNFKINMCLFVLSMAVFGASPLAEASSFQDVTGPTRVQPGMAYTYFVEVNGSFADAGWKITGGNVLEQWWEGSQFFCQAQWVESTPDKPAALEVWGKETNGYVRVERLSVTLQPVPQPTVQAGKFGDLKGPTRIQVGSTYTYTATVIGSFDDAGWNVTGGNVLQQWWEAPYFFSQVQWDGSRPEKPATLEVWGKDRNGHIKVARLAVSLQPTPSVPETPDNLPGAFTEITGPTAIQFGPTYTYSVTVEGELTDIGWSASVEGAVLKQWQQGNQFFCQVQWDKNGFTDQAKIKVWGKQNTGEIIDKRLHVTASE